MEIKPTSQLILFSILLASCTFDIKDKEDDLRKLFLCPEWEDRGAGEIRQLVEESLAEQPDAGSGSNVWQDEVAFATLVSRVYHKAGCPLPSSLDQPGSNGGSTNYCGPGSGRYLPTVDECVNQGCRTHDACYAMCSGPLDKGCYFSSTTSSCDDDFVSEIEACDISDHRFASLVAINLAKTLNAEERSGCTDIECPVFGKPGSGPCSKALGAQECEQCLDGTDQDQCRSGCDEDDQKMICIAATCPKTAECFGGYGQGASDAGTPGDAGDAGMGNADASADADAQ